MNASASLPRSPRACRPVLDRLESRIGPGSLPPTVLEQVILERINDYRAGLSGLNARPFAMLPSLRDFAVTATSTRNVNVVKNAMDKARIPWERKNSYTSGLLLSSSSTPIGDDPARLTEAAENIVDMLKVDFGDPSPLVGRPKNTLYKTHRVVGLNVTISGGDTTYRDITVSYKGTAAILTGVVYRDGNGNGRYDAGEGLPGVTIKAGNLGAATTWNTGGYTLPISVKKAAVITVTASGPGLPQTMTLTATATPNLNSRLNFKLA